MLLVFIGIDFVTVIPSVDFRLAQILTGYVCGVEFWSYLENAADIAPDTPVFRILRRVMVREVKEKVGIDIKEALNESAATSKATNEPNGPADEVTRINSGNGQH